MPNHHFRAHFQSNRVGGVAEMQKMLSGIPEVGKVYTPKGHPEVHFKVIEVDVSLTQGEEGVERSFFITCCDPADPTEKADFEFIGDEWIEIGFELEPDAALAGQ